MIGAQFSDEDFATLSDWLGRRDKGIADIVELEGFLTAVIIGPNTLSPALWLPKIWGGGKKPKFKDLDEANRFTGLVMSYYNEIVRAFEFAPDQFQPTFYEREIDGETIFIVDEWCWGFIKGLRLDTAGWKPLKRERPELLKPLELFGTSAGFRELDAGGADKMHALWSPRIEPAVRDIYAFWLPHRRRTLTAHGGRAPMH